MEHDTAMARAGKVDRDEAPQSAPDPRRAELLAAAARRAQLPLPKRKVLLTLRIDPDVIDHFRATGTGWQSRLNDALKEWIAAKGTPPP
jgi:uncharacterized protein (DUF4415 family)